MCHSPETVVANDENPSAAFAKYICPSPTPDSSPVVFAKRARREQGVMGKAKEGRLSPSVSLFPITAPRATKERQRETTGDESAALLQA